SGPAVLRCSQFVVKTMKKFKVDDVVISIDALPTMNEEQIFQQILKLMKEEPKKALKNILKGFLPERYLLFLLERNEIDPQVTFANLPHDRIRAFAKDCKQFQFTVNGTLPIEKAFVTGGGVSIKEIHPKEMESKLMKGLFFCGEILDIHGYTGGYNITSALVTGRLAGENAGKQASSIRN
ncbi:aminoacetone oxidase family FAD-binding enzyme, partial [Aeromonas veronii]|nr:aminoacetone oxidase family FAD-binding enzyme [Aeromonas veronii]